MEGNKFDWQSQAACKGQPSSYFFSDEQGAHAKDAYKSICNRCPVLSACLEFGVVHDLEGIWGGLTDRERSRMYSTSYRLQLREEMEEIGEYFPLPYNRTLAS
jgi:hypothetical protein